MINDCTGLNSHDNNRDIVSGYANTGINIFLRRPFERIQSVFLSKRPNRAPRIRFAKGERIRIAIQIVPLSRNPKFFSSGRFSIHHLSLIVFGYVRRVRPLRNRHPVA